LLDILMALLPIVSFWHGSLSWLEVLSIRSYLRQGHAVTVYAYEPLSNLPEGAECKDASDILPRASLSFYKGHGTPAVFSDRFRLELLRRNLGIYSDLDVYCVRPVVPSGPYLMAWERPGSVNNAVLLMPASAALLDDLLGIFETDKRRMILPFLPPMRRMEVALRRLLGDPLPPENMQFGATGPMPLTYFVRQHGLEDQVLDAASFYPIAYEAIPKLREPGSRIDDAISPATFGIHLWRSQLTDRGRAGLKLPHPDSALAQLCDAQGLDPATV
jgi:hypothetical protein